MKLQGFHSPVWLCMLPGFMAQGQAPVKPVSKEVSIYKADVYEPNFASKMLSPIEDIDEIPRLSPSRSAGTIRVAIVDDGCYCNAQYSDIARSACEAWVLATKSIPEGSLHFTYRITTNPAGSDVVFIFGAASQFKGYLGFTSEFGTHALVRIAVIDKQGDLMKPDRIRRITTHEVGHALGIWGHSPDHQDIMSLDLDSTTISVADVNTLRLAYKK